MFSVESRTPSTRCRLTSFVRRIAVVQASLFSPEYYRRSQGARLTKPLVFSELQQTFRNWVQRSTDGLWLFRDIMELSLLLWGVEAIMAERLCFS